MPLAITMIGWLAVRYGRAHPYFSEVLGSHARSKRI